MQFEVRGEEIMYVVVQALSSENTCDNLQYNTQSAKFWGSAFWITDVISAKPLWSHNISFFMERFIQNSPK